MTEKLEQLVAVAQRMKESTSAFTLPNDNLAMLDTAKGDHLAFVGRIERCLDGKEQVEADKLADHTCCRFGKWYFGEGSQLCGISPSFRQIDVPHKEFHQIAKQAVVLHQRGNDVEAFGQLERAQMLSGDIVSLLD